MLKPFASVILACGATAAWAADEAAQPVVAQPQPVAAQPQPVAAPADQSSIGFELSFSYILPNDRRFSGTAIGYYLFRPIGNDFEIGLYRQEGFYQGRDGDESVSERGHFDAVRGTYRFFDDAAQSAKLTAAVGYAQFTTHLPVGAFAFDLGVEYVPWKIRTGPVAAEFGLSLTYRYCRFGDVDVFDARPVNDAGGLLIGIHGSATF